MRLCQLPPEPLLPGDGVHGNAGVRGPIQVLGVGQSEQDLPDALLGQRVHQAGRGGVGRAGGTGRAVAVLQVAKAAGRGGGEVLLVVYLKDKRNRWVK